MKIAYIHTGLFPSNSPSITFATGTAVSLANKFERCYFFIKRNSRSSATEILKNNFNLAHPENLELIQITPILKTNFFYFKKIYKTLKKLIKSNKLDAIVVRNITFLPYLAKLNTTFSIPTYFESHDFYADLSVRTDINKNKKLRYQKLEKKYIPKITGIICLQHAQKQWYKKSFPTQKIIVARTGIEKIISKPFANRSFISYIGSLDPHKGVDVLIKALSLTKSQPRLLIVGGKNEKEKRAILNLAQKHHNPAQIEITGWVGKQQLLKYLIKTKLGIIPLQDTFFNRFLTSPLKLFDFYSFGIPVIASDLPTTRELIVENETGLFFTPNDPIDLAEKIDTLIFNNNIIEQMSKNIYQTAQQFLWSKRAELIYSAIESEIIRR
jgi:glycosyltransferase involved in cell wall biosynthesis